MKFSVIILSFNSERTLDRCLTDVRLALAKYNEPSEVFVVENGSKDKSPEILSRHQEEAPDLIKPIIFDENTGTTVSRNAALKQATGRYVLVLDSDAYITSDALDVLSSTIDGDNSIGMAVPKLFYGDGRFQLSTDQFPTLLHKAKRFLSLDKMQGEINTETLKSTDVDYAISACWLISRASVDAVYGFDEAIFYSPEDVEFCMQVWSKGFRIHYTTDASVVHDAQELSRGFKISFFHLSHLSGLFYLFRKYRYFFSLRALHKRLGRTG